MIDQRFPYAFQTIVMNPEIEGGAKIIRDAGGVTKYGIAQKFHPTVDVENLTEEDAKQIMFDEYWLACGCDKMTWTMALCVFDCAVNQGQPYAKHLYAMHPTDSVLFMTERAFRYTKTANFELDGHGWLKRLFIVAREAVVWQWNGNGLTKMGGS